MDYLYQWEKLPASEMDKLIELENKHLVRIEMGDKKICVAKMDDMYYGINDRCPHAGTPLTTAKICNKRGIVTCPTHHYKFDIKSGRSADGNEYKIPNYKFKQTDGEWHIGIRG